jgi:hypothetical protein
VGEVSFDHHLPAVKFPQQIHLLWDRFQVHRIAALGIATQVINRQPIRNRATKVFVCQSVGLDTLAVVFETAIEVIGQGTLPYPAALVINGYFCKKPGEDICRHWNTPFQGQNNGLHRPSENTPEVLWHTV